MPMEELYVFGTGNAQATRCYNTCFAIKDGDEYFMVDAGGGNGILRILEDMDVENETGLKPSGQRIEDLVFQKLNVETNAAGMAGKHLHLVSI